MTRLLLFYLLARLTGSPIVALLALVILWWAGDRVTFRLLPSPARLVARWRRERQLRGTLAENPHDRRSRFELAQLLLDRRRPRAAMEELRANVEAGDDDPHTAFLWGAALARSGHHEQAERALAVARGDELSFRAGDIDLELGRMRVARGDFARAAEALASFVALRPGTVEGRFHLARALAGTGDADGARRARDDAWREYAMLPRFHRSQERPFAWRLKPWRPAAVLAAVLLAAALASYWLLPEAPYGQAALGSAEAALGLTARAVRLGAPRRTTRSPRIGRCLLLPCRRRTSSARPRSARPRARRMSRAARAR
jgi:tetratricopeptide (TPR) repeat protein